MILSGIRNTIQLIFILLALNAVLAAYNRPYNHGPTPLHLTSNQRSADTGYKYAWFTRDIHDDMNSDEEKASQQQLFPQRIVQARILNSILNRKFLNQDESSPSSDEKP
ncbi:unnamed protein product [Rotaria socialis]|uniref:Uncharacterized protein n=1 Tax=Rotaria socialis TaxID=392032 RepID=A0A818RH49_9BILA|nr:unnamed protein product [Rotaria socialis]CAF3373186.1 unnamed protein product [Rotaria socialis]CAF3382022.1 unnamed protein product [Rotaria socialis]CAF3657586.1 unnamed protein product [Rotaria socialis]CAF3693526.1 unnamed protein product [Rotaria socialis]